MKDASKLSTAPKVLFVEDDQTLGSLTVRLLGEQFQVRWLRDGWDGLQEALRDGWDVLLIDRGLPSLDGLQIVRRLRAAGDQVPILLLTALSAVQDIVEGLDAGANDYLAKPYDAQELAARLRALSRRTVDHGSEEVAAPLSVGEWLLEPSQRSAQSGYGSRIALSPREFDLLSLLAGNPDRVFGRAELAGGVFDGPANESVVDTYVHYLRKKLGREVIITIQGLGYQIGHS
ncbi:two-component system response regulator QseB [Psychromicrobium silvestre]|uniref:Two-component system response regulator QseB n=1 Tax=Psychromicrobium silvestre TaxID=1645614 RepID=A0A7Y9LUL5_9MICC|nr:response regulator transcription factor [Psychromicrobium silvestre]NYE95918.1 two-component system response regulator QseB [Psychromicrobium silvestre]